MPTPGVPTRSLTDEVDRYLVWLYGMHYSTDTIRNRRSMVTHFVQWLRSQHVTRASAIDLAAVIGYRSSLRKQLSPRGTPLTIGTQIQHIVAVKSFLQWLGAESVDLEDVMTGLTLPRKPHCVPRYLMNVDTVQRVLESPPINTPLGARDRALLELLYATGLRRAEVAALRIRCLDLDSGTVTVVAGKGRRDRLVPLTPRAARWVARYLRGARQALAQQHGGDVVFVSWRGRPLQPKWVSERVRRYLLRTGVVASGSAHLFRHAMATHLLEGGADIRYIQHILGHTRLSTTAVYAQVSLARLQEVYAGCHPLYE